MAITNAQQARQLYKKGSKKPVVQGGVDNYLGDQPEVQAPRKWLSSPDKPATELAYITEAEKDLILKANIHGGLEEGPNMGPSGIISLDSFGDIGGGQSGAQYDSGQGSGKQSEADNNAGNMGGGSQQDQDNQQANLDNAAKKQEEKFKSEKFKEEKKEAKKDLRNLKKKDAARRKSKLRAILSKKKTYNTFKIDPKTGKPVAGGTINLAGYDEEGNPLDSNNPFGISNIEYQDLISSLPSGSSLNINPLETDAVNEEIRQKAVNDYLAKTLDSTDKKNPLVELMEKNDRFSGVNLEAFQNEFNLPKSGITALDVALGFASPFLQKGSKKTKEFFSGTEDGLGNTIFGKPRKSVLEAGKYTIDGMPISPEQFAMLDPALMDDVYKDYTGRRLSGEIDAYGNPTNLNTGGGGQQQDPCLGPNPPAYCNVGGDDDDDDDTTKRNLGGLAPRFAGSIFDFTGMADGGRAGAMDGGRMMMDDDPTGGIMDLESGRQMYFLGKLVKKASRAIKKVVKSPIGKAALLYFGGNALMSGGGGGLSSFFKSGKGLGFKDFLTKSFLGPELSGRGNRSGGILGFMKNNPYLSILGGSSILAGLSGKGEDEGEIDYGPGIDIKKYRFDPYGTLAPGIIGSNYQTGTQGRKDGGRMGYAEGSEEPVAKETMPLIDMDGKEMDLREDGGFVPLGRMERADDVPARLSKNEFVFTADAVRNAGEGDIDKGAEVMYNMMKNLESGGDVSEESQGLDGAREMFQTSQRLEEVL